MKGRMYGECVWIVRTLQEYGKLSLRELNELWTKTEMSGGLEMDRRTFQRHEHTIEDTFGIRIACENKGGYRYYISNKKDVGSDSAIAWLMNALTVSEKLLRYVSLHDRILLESVPTSDWRFDLITEAMETSHWVSFRYLPYQQLEIRDVEVMPYCLKIYRHRWYLLGRFRSGNFATYCLDRMKTLTITDRVFKMDEAFDAADYFSLVIGVVNKQDHRVEQIIVRAYEDEACYLRDVPLHQSQTEIGSGDGFSDFSYLLKPNHEFFGCLLQRGDRVKVLYPEHIESEMRERILNIGKNYNP